MYKNPSQIIQKLKLAILAGLLLWLPLSLNAATPFSVPVAVEAFLSLQGRTAGSGPDKSIPLLVQFYLEGDDVPTLSLNVQTDENGFFSIPDTGLDAGNYVIAIKNEHSLRVAWAGPLIEGSNVPDFPQLPEGDANGDNVVTIVDFSILSSSFGLSTGQVGYDDRADFNENGAITIQDFSLLSTNFGQSGYVVTTTSYGELISAQGGRVAGQPQSIPFYGEVLSGTLSDVQASEVDMRLELSGDQASGRITATVLVASAGQPFDAAEASLRYDRERLELVSYRITDVLPLALLEQTEDGVLHIAAGTLGELPRGQQHFLTAEFRVKGNATGADLIQWVRGESAVTYAGRNILGTVISDAAGLECVECTPEITVYPNPSHGILNIQTAGTADQGTIQISDLRGNILSRYRTENIQNNLTIDLTHLPSGVYMLQVQTADSRSVHRIIKN